MVGKDCQVVLVHRKLMTQTKSELIGQELNLLSALNQRELRGLRTRAEGPWTLISCTWGTLVIGSCGLRRRGADKGTTLDFLNLTHFWFTELSRGDNSVLFRIVLSHCGGTTSAKLARRIGSLRSHLLMLLLVKVAVSST